MKNSKINEIIFTIGKISGIAMIISGFFHFFIGNKIADKMEWEDKYHKSMRLTQLGFTIIVFGVGLYFIVRFFVGII